MDAAKSKDMTISGPIEVTCRSVEALAKYVVRLAPSPRSRIRETLPIVRQNIRIPKLESDIEDLRSGIAISADIADIPEAKMAKAVFVRRDMFVIQGSNHKLIICDRLFS